MTGIVRSAGTVYVDVALGSTDQVRADARALKVEVDQILNDGGNNVNAQMGNGATAGAAYKAAFEKATEGLSEGIDKELESAVEDAIPHGESAGSAFKESFSKQVEDLKDTVTPAFKDIENDSEAAGSSSGLNFYGRFKGAFTDARKAADDALKDIEKDSGDSGGRSGSNWGSSFFNSASGWFKKLQEADTGIGGFAGALAPLGIAGGAGVLSGAGSILSSVGAPLLGAAAGGGLLKSLITGASTNLTTISSAGGNQVKLASAVDSAGSAMTKAQAKAQLDAIDKLNPAMQSFIGTLGQANLSYLTLSGSQKTELAHLTAGTKAYKDLDPAQQAVVKSLQAQSLAYSALSPTQQGFVLSLNTLKASFADVQNNASPAYLSAFQNLVKAAIEILTKFQPILNSTGKSFDTLSQSILKGVGGPTFKAFLDKINTSIQGGAITKLADGIGNIAAAIGILWTKDAGSGTFLTHIDNIGKAFKGWASAQGATGGFTTFLDYLKTNGDHLGQIVEGIAKELAKIGPSVAGFGTTELSLLTDLFNVIEMLPTSVAGTLVDVASALLLFQKLKGFAAVSAITGFFGSAEGEVSSFRKLTGALGDGAAAVQLYGGALANFIGSEAKSFGTWIASTATSGFSSFTGAMAKAGSGIASFVSSIGTAIAAGAKWVAENTIEIASLVAEKVATAASAAAEGIATAAQWLWNLAMDAFPLILIVSALIALVAVIIKYHTQIINFVIKVWDDIWAFLKQWWYVIVIGIVTGGLGLIVGLIIKYHNQIWAFIQRIWHDVANFFVSTYHDIERDAENAWNSIYQKITNTASNIWHDTVNTLKNMARDIANVFVDIANMGFITPIDWVITNIINGGILRAINDVTSVVGISAISNVPTIPQVSHFAEGGVVKGGVPGKDSVPAMLMPDEVVLSKDQVAKFGGHAAIAAMVGGARPVMSHGVVHAGWGWNPIADIQQAASDVGSAASAAWSDLKSVALGGLRSAVGTVINPLVNEIPGQNTLIGRMLKGSVQTVVNDVLNWLGNKDKSATASVNLPGNAISWITQGMKAAGVSGADWQSGLEIIAQGESGGNQSSVNTTDSNAQAGHPSAGLMQFIQSTFQSYAKPGYTTWMNPIDQVVADAWPQGYITQRYGSIDNVPGVKSVRSGGSYVGYDSGGLLQPGTTATYNGLSQPEAILTPAQWNTMAALAAKGSQAPTVNVYIGNEQFTDFVSEVVTNDLTDLSNSLVGGRIV